MNKLAFAAVLALAGPAIAAQSGAPLRATLTSYQEVPAVSSKADGEFEARVSADGNSVDFVLAYDGLQADVTQAHIHFAQKSVNGPIVVWLCQTATNPSPTAGVAVCPGRSGVVRGTFTSANVLASPATQQLAAGELAELIAAMRKGVAYVNVHSAVSTGGEIRGQIGARGHSGR